MRRSFVLSVTLVVGLFAGCASEGATEADGRDDTFLAPTGAADAWGVTEGSAQAVAVLRVANEYDREALLGDAALPSTTVNALLAYRAGKDAELGTADDVTIPSLTELDAIPYVGPLAFAKLLDEAVARGWTTITGGSVVTPSSDPNLARVVVKFPVVNGITIPAAASVSRAKQCQKTASEVICDVEPGASCITLDAAFGSTERCGYRTTAGSVTTAQLGAAHIDDLQEIYGVNIGKPASVSGSFRCDDDCRDWKIEYVSTGDFATPAKYLAEGYYPLLAGTYTVWVAGESSVIEVAEGQVLEGGFIPTKETRAYIWVSADPMGSSTVPVQTKITAKWQSHGGLSGDTQEKTLAVKTEADGQRTVEPLYFRASTGSQLSTVTFTFRPGGIGTGLFTTKIKREPGTSANLVLRRLEVPRSGLGDPKIAENAVVERVGDAGGVIAGQRVEFTAGLSSMDVPADLYQVTLSNAQTGAVLKVYTIDLR